MKLVVLGAAESGVGAAILAQKQGYEVFVSDMGNIKPRYKQMLNEHHIAWEEGHHTETEVLTADEVVKSPGIPETAPMVAKLVAKGTPILSEIEFAGRYTHARMVCITGSNGKTTTTSLIYHILKKAGEDVGLAGNIGHSLALQVAEAPHSTYVIELSSFQLDNMYKFRANIAVLLNITPDHLDRYDFKMQNYVDAKMRILQNQTADDTFVYWQEDEHVPNELHKYDDPSHKCGFTDEQKEGSAGYADNGKFVVNTPVHFEMPLAELSLPGRHNLRNSLAAAIACLAYGIDPEVVRQGLSDFPGVEHRLEKAGTKGGIHFVNDSKATNVDACYCALESMTTPVVLILGGKDKGNDYTQIVPFVKQKCRALVYMGVDNAKLHDNFDQLGLPVADTHSMCECMEQAVKLAQPGDTVLLSPCCASFDLFKNMEDRGEQFKAWVKNWSDK
ncbi:MAG: UDP-N-acetylmuramoyl-L-alanine--D-glutamate ligase [Prevotella sp.]|nr:UDP-N-acetylmuramoyl-L-alanine--D-glutamate ligase [Prevotella sp.]MDY5667296.1 UDP-N-acetylmuramoyl-L-alanine--D-glutamate ligase [Alloprevotella sp.]